MAMAVMSIMTVACTDYDLNGQTDWKGDEPLELSASISETLPTRAEEELAEGTYYFSYVNSKQTSVKYETTKVSFEAGNSTPDLTWDQINTNKNIANKLFILDNVPRINGEFTSSNTNRFINLKDIKKGGTDTESRYNAGPAPTVPGEGNDLLWDTVKVENVSGAPLSPVHFDLEHRMSMLTFKLLSNNDSEINTLLSNPEKVEVKLHRVITEPYQFNRLTGAITNNTKPIDETQAVTLDITGYTSEEGAITESWIFPPQEFHNTGRPVLAITLTDTENQTRTFKGVLPESMLYEGKYEPLEFFSGCHLTVTVVLGNWDDLAINFRPVLVKKWVTYSAKDINAKQVGVYTAEELTELVNAYNANSSENNLALWKYGTYDKGNSTWTFYLWKDLTGVTETDNSLGFITEEGKPSFTFKANGHTINGKTVETNGTLTDNSTTDGGE